METIFRKVSVNERLPNKTGRYFCLGNVYGNLTSLFFNNQKRWMELQDEYHPEYWLEEIELPTDEEIEKEGMKIDSQEEIHDYYNHGKMVGMKWMRRFVLAVAPLTSKTNGV